MAPCALLVVLALALAQASAIAFPRLDGTPDPFEPMPVNLTIAFIGDQGPSDTPDWDFPDKIMRPNAVLQLVRNESAHAVLHQGDFDYRNNASAWEQLINSNLGPDFPYFATPGNHDERNLSDYVDVIYRRLQRQGVRTCNGTVGDRMVCSFKGLVFVLSSVGLTGNPPLLGGHEAYMKQSLETYGGVWRLCSWHKNQRLMQLGDKRDEVGWDAYDTCRRAGAIVCTGHEHSYSRTFLMTSFEDQNIAPSPDPHNLVLSEGQTFAFVNGVGGRAARPCVGNSQRNPWWASAWCRDNSLEPGALICRFNFNGDPTKAFCQFKQFDGTVRDQFTVVSTLQPPGQPGEPQPPPSDRRSPTTVALVVVVVMLSCALALTLYKYFHDRAALRQQLQRQARSLSSTSHVDADSELGGLTRKAVAHEDQQYG